MLQVYLIAFDNCLWLWDYVFIAVLLLMYLLAFAMLIVGVLFELRY